MEDRRKYKRVQMQSKIMVKRLDDEIQEEVFIDITDVSKSGVGFRCPELLDIGSVYESYLTIWTKEVLHSFLQIVRIELREDGYEYGAIFIGMPEVEASRIEIYPEFSESDA